MSDQARHWSRAAANYEAEFVDPYLPEVRSPLLDALAKLEFHRRALTDLTPFAGQVDVAVAVNSLVLPDVAKLEEALRQSRAALRPGGHFLGIVPAIDGVH